MTAVAKRAPPSKAIVVRKRASPVSLEQLEPGFVYAPGEPYFAEPNLERPQSVWSAIYALKVNEPEAWAAMGRDLFGLRRRRSIQLIMAEGVLWKALEVNTVEPESPMRVWLDPEGQHVLKVYRDNETRRRGRTQSGGTPRARRSRRSM
jgi:hypothetical protein